MADIGFNEIYSAIAPYVVTRILEFDAPSEPEMDEFEYVQSDHRPPAYSLLAHLDEFRYASRAPLSPPFGPVESEILQFFADPSTHNLILVGDIGSGKTTTLRYLLHRYVRPAGVLVNYIDFRPSLQSFSEPETEDYAPPAPSSGSVLDRVLIENTSAFTNDYLQPDEEIKDMWTWAFSQSSRPPSHPAARVLQPIRERLRLKSGTHDAEHCELPHMLARRRKALDALLDAGDRLTVFRYVLLRVAYLVATRYHGDPTKVLFVIDNVDQAPWAFHARLFDYAHAIAYVARCKVLIALRPHSYASASASSCASAGHTVYYHVEHGGPDLHKLLRGRLNTRLIELSDELLAERLSTAFTALPAGSPRRVVISSPATGYEVEFGQLRIPFSFIRRWFTAVRDVLFARDQHTTETHSARPTAASFITGLASNSLRIGKLLAVKVMQTNAIRLPEILGIEKRRSHTPSATRPMTRAAHALTPTANPTAGRPIADPEAIRAMILKDKDCFLPKATRIIDNVFSTSCGRPEALLCKLRILFYLHALRDAYATVADVWHYATSLEYDESVLIASLNSMLHQKKRLLSSDMLERIDSGIDTCKRARLCIAPAGIFYVEHLISDLTYVEEMIDSSNVPLRNMSTGNVVERMQRVRRFCDEILARDAYEAETCVAMGRSQLYARTHQNKLFSVGMIRALSMRVERVLAPAHASSREWWSSELVVEASNEIGEWQNYLLQRAEATERQFAEELAKDVSVE